MPQESQECRLFTDTDYFVVRDAICSLSDEEQTAVLLRFWDRKDLVSIAEHLGVDFEMADRILLGAFEKLRNFCLAAPGFSRRSGIESSIAA